MCYEDKQRVSLQLGGSVLVQHEQTFCLISINTKEKNIYSVSKQK